MRVLIKVGNSNACLPLVIMTRIVRKSVPVGKAIRRFRGNDLLEYRRFTAPLLADNHVTPECDDIQICFMVLEGLKQDVIIVSIGAAEVINVYQGLHMSSFMWPNSCLGRPA